MTTLGIMKERIASELRRDDLSSATEFRVLAAVSDIHDAIHTAIAEYQNEQFWFQQKRDILTFNTVAEQWQYTSADAAAIARVAKIEWVKITIATFVTSLIFRHAEGIENTNTGAGALSSQPRFYGWYADSLLIEPIPDAAYAVRVGGMFNMTAPASDSEASNPWMVYAERLIRSRAKAELYEHVLRNDRLADRMRFQADDALRVLRTTTEQRLAPEMVLTEPYDPFE